MSLDVGALMQFVGAREATRRCQCLRSTRASAKLDCINGMTDDGFLTRARGRDFSVKLVIL
jgi:hypothetical protein